MYRIRFGFATRLIFFIWSMRFWFVCIRPAVSIRTTSRPRARACSTAALRDPDRQGRLRGRREARGPGAPFSLEVLREAVHDLLGDGECHVRLEEGDLQVVQDCLELVLFDLATGVADRLRGHLGFRL